MKTTRLAKTLCLAPIFAVVLCATAASAQQTPPPPAPTRMPSFPVTPNTNLVSPEVHSDGKVTFRVWAPSAKEVKLSTEGAEAVPGATPETLKSSPGGVAMTQGDEGVWSITVGPYPAGAYRYNFQVDGVSATDPKNAAASESLTQVRSLYRIPGNFADANNVPHGSVATVYYQSTALDKMRRMHVYFPPGYEKGQIAYPVLYLLHGGGDSDDSWPTVGQANFILDNLLAAGQTKPMIVVMPAGHTSQKMDFSSMTLDVSQDPFAKDFLQDVVPFVEQHYRVVADAQHRAIAGLSMGGIQTLNIALTNPGFFSWVGVFSSGWFGDMRSQFEQKHHDALQSPEKKAVRLFWFGAGKYDIAMPNTQPTIDLVKKYGYTPEFHPSEGFHAWNNWRDYLHDFAPRLFQN